MSPTSGTVIATVPARAEHLHVIRAVIGSVAARHELTIDAIDDLRIAVDEACAQLIRAGGETITVSIAADATGVEVVCRTDARVSAWPPEGLDRTLAAQVLRGLTDEVTWGRADGRPSVRIRKRGVAADR